MKTTMPLVFVAWLQNKASRAEQQGLRGQQVLHYHQLGGLKPLLGHELRLKSSTNTYSPAAMARECLAEQRRHSGALSAPATRSTHNKTSGDLSILAGTRLCCTELLRSGLSIATLKRSTPCNFGLDQSRSRRSKSRGALPKTSETMGSAAAVLPVTWGQNARK